MQGEKIRPPSNSAPFPHATDRGVWNGWLIGDGALNGAVWRRLLLPTVTWYVFWASDWHTPAQKRRERKHKLTDANSSTDKHLNSDTGVNLTHAVCSSSFHLSQKKCPFYSLLSDGESFAVVFWFVCICSTNILILSLFVIVDLIDDLKKKLLICLLSNVYITDNLLRIIIKASFLYVKRMDFPTFKLGVCML